MVLSIMILIVTVLLLLNHEQEKAMEEKLEKLKPCARILSLSERRRCEELRVDEFEAGNRSISWPRKMFEIEPSPSFRKFIVHTNYFLGLLSFLFGLTAAEILDTAANPFIPVGRRRLGHLKQRFFYRDALHFGGSGYYYVTIGLFLLLTLSIFSLLIGPLTLSFALLIGLLLACVYFFGYYEYGRGNDEPHIVLSGEREPPAPPRPWIHSSPRIHWGAFLGIIFGAVIIIFSLLGFAWLISKVLLCLYG